MCSARKTVRSRERPLTHYQRSVSKPEAEWCIQEAWIEQSGDVTTNVSRDEPITARVRLVFAAACPEATCTRSSISPHSRETWPLEMPSIPMARTRLSTERVEMPWCAIDNSSAAPNSDPRKCVWFAWRRFDPGSASGSGRILHRRAGQITSHEPIVDGGCTFV